MHVFSRSKNGAAAAATADLKEPSVCESNLNTLTPDGSPPLTSSLHSRNSASSAQESAYLRRASVLKWLRLVLALSVVAVGLTIVGCASHVLRRYDATVFGGEWFLPLWPVNIDLRPMLAELVPGALVSLLGLGYICFGVVPSPRSRFSAQNVVFAFMSILGLVVALFAVIYSHVVTYAVDAGVRETLLTFTCGLYDNARSFASSGERVDLGVSTSAIVPQGFGRLCIESQIVRWMVVALFVLEVFALVVAAVGMMGDAKIAKVRKSRYEGFREEKSAFA